LAEGKSDRAIYTIMSIKTAFKNFDLVGREVGGGAVAQQPFFGCTPAYVYRAVVVKLAFKVYIRIILSLKSDVYISLFMLTITIFQLL